MLTGTLLQWHVKGFSGISIISVRQNHESAREEIEATLLHWNSLLESIHEFHSRTGGKPLLVTSVPPSLPQPPPSLTIIPTGNLQCVSKAEVRKAIRSATKLRKGSYNN